MKSGCLDHVDRQARSLVQIWGSAGPQKSGLFEPYPPLTLLKVPQFLAHFVTKSGPLGRFGVVLRTPAPHPTSD